MFKVFVFITILIVSTAKLSFAEGHHSDHTNHADHTDHGDSHEGHLHEQFVDGKALDVDADRFDKFVEDLNNVQIVIVSVQGMVCDFCAQGIEKTFGKDNLVRKIDVDLSKGKVLLAYSSTSKLDFDVIRGGIISNGLNATNIQVLDI